MHKYKQNATKVDYALTTDSNTNRYQIKSCLSDSSESQLLLSLNIVTITKKRSSANMLFKVSCRF